MAVVGLEDGIFPPRVHNAQDAEDAAEMDKQERRLFQVGMSRAMRRLLIVYSKTKPSLFVADLDFKLWDCVSM